ncbi:MAG: four helix bundle protein [Patescibacteria group bacterium]|nr:four helix bundle protein [Patescibacteria group bacterium]
MERREVSSKKEKFKIRVYKYIIKLLRFLRKIPYDIVVNELRKQLIRSGTSIGANYFEAEAASSKKDFQNYFHISLKSANESKFWLGILLDSNFLSQGLILEAKFLLQETKEIANILAASLITMKNNNSNK